ncbi:hypothetical protein [Sinorhizobium meliloti]|jgi:hypothetical protein|nr:hypothetical protein [Sinorhizobium meliloti]
MATTELSIDLVGVSPSKSFTGAIYSLTNNQNAADPLAAAFRDSGWAR